MTLADRIFDWFMENVMTWLVIVLIALVLVGLPIMFIAEYRAEKFSLRKDEWNCTASVERPVTTYIQSGQVLVPITSYHKHCTQWTEKP